MKKKRTVVLGIFADRIDVLVCGRDQAIDAKRVEVDLNVEGNKWASALSGCLPHVRSAIEQLGVVGAPALVVYRNATSFADLASLAMKSASQARDAAMLGIAESLSYPLDIATTAAMVLGRDATGSNPQTHVIVAADQDQTTADIANFVEDAGLIFEAAVPMDAALLAHVGATTLNSTASNKGHLYVGEHRSFFIIADRGAILFARKIDLGVDTLTWSLTRPLRPAANQTPIELPYAQAKLILHKFGFPQREQFVHDSLQLTGAQVIPLLQPALQRFIVELRQSLRFGVQEEQRQGMELTVSGPGSAIPNFASLIANELRIPVTTDSGYASYDCQNPLTVGSEITDAMRSSATARLGLQPASVSKSRTFKRMRRWFLTGAAAAIGIVGFDAWSYHQRLADARQRVHNIASQAGDIHAMQATADKLFKVIGDVEAIQSLIGAEAGAALDVRACLHELSRITPKSIRLVSITFTTEKGQSKARLTGSASSTGSRTELEQFVAGLKASPLFSEVVLSNVQTTPDRQGAGQQFEINLAAVAVPRGGEAFAIASTTSGDVTP